jgi:predicted MFS family arabinose efflux permease
MSNINNDISSIDHEASAHRRVLLTIIIASSVAWVPSFLAGILLLDIGNTFGYPIGVTGQIFTAARIVGVVSALLLGMFTVRYRSKTLLIVGLLAFMVFSVSCFLAPSFNIMLVSFSLSGLGLAIVMPMSMSLVGEHLPAEKRASAIGLISAFTAVPGLFFGPLIGLVVKIGGWRLAFLVFILPLSVLGLLAVLRWLPTETAETEGVNVDLLKGFKEIYRNRSAQANLIGYALALSSMTAVASYSPSYLRETFPVSTVFVSTVFSGVNILYSLGSVACARIVDRFGRKRVLVGSLILESFLIIVSMNIPNLWLTLTIIYLSYMMMGFVYTVAISLALEQLPGFQGTMMSLNTAAGNLGMAMGSAAGGLILLLYDYGPVSLSLGALGIIATITYQTQVKDQSSTP